MAKRKFQVGDKVRVVGMPNITLAPGVKDEMGTKRLFRYMQGRLYTVRGFGKYGFIELCPTRRDTAWIEPEFLKVQKRSSQTAKTKR